MNVAVKSHRDMDLEPVEPLRMHMQYVEFLFCDKSCTDVEMKLMWLEAGTHRPLIHILLEYAAASGSTCSWNVTRKYGGASQKELPTLKL